MSAIGKPKTIKVFSPSGGEAIMDIPCDGYEPRQISNYCDSLIIKQDDNAIIRIDRKGGVMHKVVGSSRHKLFACVTQGNSVLIASVRHAELTVGLLNIDEYTSDLKHVKTLISEYRFMIREEHWYYLQHFHSGELGFCTANRLYIFHLSTTPVNS